MKSANRDSVIDCFNQYPQHLLDILCHVTKNTQLYVRVQLKINILWISPWGRTGKYVTYCCCCCGCLELGSTVHLHTPEKHTYAHSHTSTRTQLSQAVGRQWDGWPTSAAGFEDRRNYLHTKLAISGKKSYDDAKKK